MPRTVAFKNVRRSRSSQDLHCPRPPSIKLDRGTLNTLHQSRPATPYPYDNPSHGRPNSHLPLSRAGTIPIALRDIHFGRSCDGNRSHSSNSCSPVVHRTSGRRRHTLRRTAKILPLLEAPATRLQKLAALEQAISVDRNFLHAMRLRLTHPESGKTMEFETPLPADLEGWLTRLRSPVQQK